MSTGADSVTENNIKAIARLEKRAAQKHTYGERLAETVTQLAGSVQFIVIHVVWFLFWIAANANLIPGIAPWDPFPYSFLTLVVSLEAIFLSLLVLMTQNRLTRDADKRAQLDLQINMLAEQESTATLQMLEKICQHLGVNIECEIQAQLAKNTDVNMLAKTLEEKLPQ
ncbi:MAG: DUF1003 domain-containing protein [Thiobacillus sp.]